MGADEPRFVALESRAAPGGRRRRARAMNATAPDRGLATAMGASIAWKQPSAGPMRILAPFHPVARDRGFARFRPRDPVEREARPRIAALTANAMQGDRAPGLAAGMDDDVTQSIRGAALVQPSMLVAPELQREGR